MSKLQPMVAEVVDDCTSKFGRSKVFEHVRGQSHQAYDQVTTNVRSKILTIVLKSHDLSERSWTIVLANSVSARFLNMFKTSHLRF